MVFLPYAFEYGTSCGNDYKYDNYRGSTGNCKIYRDVAFQSILDSA